MYIRFSETHGPSKFDLAGLLIIAMGFLPMVKEVWKKRSYIHEKLGGTLWWTMIFLSVLPLGLIALALYLVDDFFLWTSVGVCVLSQGVLIFNAFYRETNQQV
jgi:hypothetical protein